jgi:predicted ATPase
MAKPNNLEITERDATNSEGLQDKPRPIRVVLTGGACAGKTTLLGYFARRGYRTVPEAALAVIQRLNRTMGVERQRAWRDSHLLEFQRMIVAQQLRQEAALPKQDCGPVFFDRGLADGVGYLRQAGIEPPTELVQASRAAYYSHIFLLHTLARFAARRATGRPDTRDYSLAIAAAVRAAYVELGYEVIEVPEMPVERRAAFILERISKT